MVIAFCRFCNIIKLQFLYYFKNNVSRAKKLWILMVLILCRNVKSNLHNAPKCLQVSQIQNVNRTLPGLEVYTKDFYTKMSSFIKEFECTQFHTREVFVSSVSPVYNLSMDLPLRSLCPYHPIFLFGHILLFSRPSVCQSNI